MPNLVPDPFAQGGVVAFASQFRAGTVTSLQATTAFLARIDAVDGRLGAYQHVAHEAALATARAVDALRAAGTDLGPLMGVPIAIKDLIAVEGMPTTAGTLLAVDDLVGKQGPVVTALRRAGCVILGKVKTVEFALGITGVSKPQGTPHNPWSADVAYLPGGSSSGSGVATAAGLCGFAVGSDTGGSVRVPAAMNGIFGLKTSFGRFSNEGAFPLASHLDSIGLLARSAADAALVYTALTGERVGSPADLSRTRLGRPSNYFFDGLDSAIAERMASALSTISAAGVSIDDLEVPEAPEREAYFPVVLPVCLIAALGRERAEAGLERMDPIIAQRVASGFSIEAVEIARLERRRSSSRKSALARFEGYDAWVTPTTADLPSPAADLDEPEKGLRVALGMTRNTQPANYLDLAAASLPMPIGEKRLPAGLQLMVPSGEEVRLLSLCLAIEALLGVPRLPDVSAFSR